MVPLIEQEQEQEQEQHFIAADRLRAIWHKITKGDVANYNFHLDLGKYV